MTDDPARLPSPYRAALAAIWDRSGYDRGYISNPFAGDEAARLGLRRTQAVLDALGYPHARLPLVHVAGSKGKGSTTVLIDAILRAAGLRSGRYTSPHLHTFRERIVIDDHPIGEDDFAALTREALDAATAIEARQPDLGRVTAFELSTAMALAWFDRRECDIAVIEVGLGGTLDATNVIDPAVAVITRLDLEHTAILGETLPEIAANKAGIIKPGRPAVTIAHPPDALAVIEARAREVGAPLLVERCDWSLTGNEDGFAVAGPWGTIRDLRTSLAGPHQVENAALAVAAVRATAAVSPRIDDAAIRSGLLQARHPGRFERLACDDGTAVVIDGAHTPVAAEALAATIRRHLPGERVTIVVGMLLDKRPEGFLAPLMPIAARWIVARPDSPRGMPAEELIAALHTLGQPADAARSVADALALARQGSAPVVVTGSLTTVAEARVALGLAVPDPSPVR